MFLCWHSSSHPLAQPVSSILVEPLSSLSSCQSSCAPEFRSLHMLSGHIPASPCNASLHTGYGAPLSTPSRTQALIIPGSQDSSLLMAHSCISPNILLSQALPHPKLSLSPGQFECCVECPEGSLAPKAGPSTRTIWHQDQRTPTLYIPWKGSEDSSFTGDKEFGGE